MNGFKQDIWGAIERNGKLIYNNDRRVIAIDFNDRSLLDQFLECAHNGEIWHNPFDKECCNFYQLDNTLLLLWKTLEAPSEEIHN